ncbi:type I restriction enzyme, S subunit [Pseudomonas benzenivorans]|nr:restriction endonuclease subunit S [Pseudomonas benzenivorans]SDG73101.1 type I restriction enzyme, S subunit [Pseudomonas benzenivorans]
MRDSESRKVTATGGRGASARHIPPKLALAVGLPSCTPPTGWQWRALGDMARLESGHTPSRRHPEYWGGAVPWISIRDAKAHHGRTIDDTAEKTNELGIKNSSARLLPARTVCLSRTASVGYVVVTAQPMATSQDFVNWICGEELEPEFLQYLFLAEGADLLRFASGAVHQTIYFPEAKAFHACVPSRAEQQRIVAILDEAFDGIAKARANAEKNLQNARALFASHLQSVFNQEGDGWQRTTVGDQIMLQRGFDITKDQQNRDGSVPVVSSGGVKSFHDTAMVEAPGVVIGRKGTLGKVFYLERDFWPHDTTLWVKDFKGNDPRLVYYLFAGLDVKDLDSGTANPALNRNQVHPMKINWPPVTQQMAIALTLDSLQEETQRLEAIYQQKLASLDELKKSLLHQAFSGNL